MEKIFLPTLTLETCFHFAFYILFPILLRCLCTPHSFLNTFAKLYFYRPLTRTSPPHRAVTERQESCRDFFFLVVSLALHFGKDPDKRQTINCSSEYIKTIFERVRCCAALTFYTRFTFKTAYKFLNFYTNVLEKSPLHLADSSSAMPFRPLGICTTLLGF